MRRSHSPAKTDLRGMIFEVLCKKYFWCNSKLQIHCKEDLSDVLVPVAQRRASPENRIGDQYTVRIMLLCYPTSATYRYAVRIPAARRHHSILGLQRITVYYITQMLLLLSLIGSRLSNTFCFPSKLWNIESVYGEGGGGDYETVSLSQVRGDDGYLSPFKLKLNTVNKLIFAHYSRHFVHVSF